MSADWHVAYTAPRREFAVRDELTMLGAETYLPTITMRRYRRRPLQSATAPIASESPLFPRYLFTRGLDPWSIAKTRGVVGIVSAAGEPLLFPHRLMPQLRLDCAMAAREAQSHRQRPEWKIGDWVTVPDESPLAGFRGQIKALAKGGEALIYLQQLGGIRVPIERLTAAAAY